MNAENIKYIAYEGGGGKGIVYLGATRALEAAGKLPMIKKGKDLDADSQKLIGVAGASAGSINAFFTALGQTADEAQTMTAKITVKSIFLEEDYEGYKAGEIVPHSENIIKVLKTRNGLPHLILEKEMTLFSLFYDQPNPGLYKGVKYDPDFVEKELKYGDKGAIVKPPENGANIPCWGAHIVTSIPKVYEGKNPGLHKLWKILNIILPGLFPIQRLKVITGHLFTTLDEAQIQADRSNFRLRKAFSMDGLLNKIGKAMHPIFKNSSNQVVQKIFENTTDFPPYITSLLNDRGAFSGFNVSRILTVKMQQLLKQNFGCDLDYDRCRRLTMFDFVNITGNDIRLAGANLARQMPVFWSGYNSPDMPIIDATCMSMAIPLAFKPTFNNGWSKRWAVQGTVDTFGRVKLTRKSADIYSDIDKDTTPQDSSYNRYFRGFYNDGGTLQNLPIHAYDYWKNEDDYMQKIVPLNPHIFAIRCSGGMPFDQDEDPFYKKDLLYAMYKEMDRKMHLKDTIKGEKQETPLNESDKNLLFFEENWDFRFSGIIKFAKTIMNTLMYDMEEGQIRSAEELKQTMNLFSYGIGLFDFTAPTELSYFAQIRAMIKVAINIGVKQEDVMKVIQEKYLQKMPGDENSVALFEEGDERIKKQMNALNDYWTLLSERLKNRKPDIYFPNVS
jgi:predicted acylesterase/phospholipase RssA